MSAVTLCWHSWVMQRCKFHTHALLTLLFVPWSVSPWTSRILGHISHCYVITDCCHVEDKSCYSPCLAVSPFSPSSLSNTVCRLHSFHLPHSLPASCDSPRSQLPATGRTEHHSPPDAANHSPILDPIGGPLGIGISSIYGEQQHWHCNGAV